MTTKAHAEYIQATSRVGRDDARPGLVLTLLNVHKPRDRSHYERFRHYHETFYRSVEVGRAYTLRLLLPMPLESKCEESARGVFQSGSSSKRH